MGLINWLTDKLIDNAIKRALNKSKDLLPKVKEKAIDIYEDYKEDFIKKVRTKIEELADGIIKKAESKIHKQK